MCRNYPRTLIEQVDAVVETHKLGFLLRQRLDRVSAEPAFRVSLDDTLTASAPSRLPWVIYDHCAALTRIYSILEIFYASFTREICQILTRGSLAHSGLDEKTRIAYRKGIARILLEIHEKHYHRQLDIQGVSSMFHDAISGTTPYKLLPDAFLVNKRALRLGELLSRLSDLGFDNVESGLVSHPLIQLDIASSKTKRVGVML